MWAQNCSGRRYKPRRRGLALSKMTSFGSRSPTEANGPPLEAPAWPQWADYLRNHHASFKRHVVRRLQAEHVRDSECDVTSVCLWALRNTLPFAETTGEASVVWKCWPCRCTFDTRRKLSVHFFKKHQRVAEYRRYVNGTVCAGCGRQYWSGGRLAAHLRASPLCMSALRQAGQQAPAIMPLRQPQHEADGTGPVHAGCPDSGTAGSHVDR